MSQLDAYLMTKMYEYNREALARSRGHRNWRTLFGVSR
jgi:hypothetical protein